MIWKAIPGFFRYEVSDAGDVRNAHGLPHRHSTPSDSGYVRVRIHGRLLRLHRVVLFAFVGPPPSTRHHGAHLDGDKTNNSLDNLAWKLPVENEADKRLHGTAPRGGAQRAPSPQVVGKVRAALARGASFTSVARRFGLHRSTVSRYARGLRRAA